MERFRKYCDFYRKFVKISEKFITLGCTKISVDVDSCTVVGGEFWGSVVGTKVEVGGWGGKRLYCFRDAGVLSAQSVKPASLHLEQGLPVQNFQGNFSEFFLRLCTSFIEIDFDFYRNVKFCTYVLARELY